MGNKNNRISSCIYKDKEGKEGLAVNFFWTRKRQPLKAESVAYRIGHNPKRWSSSYGPFTSLRNAELDFHNRFLKKIPMIYEKDYSFFYNSAEDAPDGVVTLVIVDLEDKVNSVSGYYGMLKVRDKVLWVSRNLHIEFSEAFLEGYTTLNSLYPKIEPYE